MKKTILLSALTLTLVSCGDKQATPPIEEAVNEKLTDCDMTISGIHFTKALNGADGQVMDSAGIVTFRAKPHADYFNDPNDGKLSQSNAAVLLTEVDNAKPFTFSARLKTGFTKDGLYNAATLFVYANDSLYQKFCFEQVRRQQPRGAERC